MDHYHETTPPTKLKSAVMGEQSTKKTMTEEPLTLTINLDNPVEDIMMQAIEGIFNTKGVVVQDLSTSFTQKKDPDRLIITGIEVKTYKWFHHN